MRFQGKNVLITGGNSGIGFAVAKRIVSEGGRVILTGRNAESLKQALAELGPSASGWVSDVSKVGAITELFARVAREVGTLHGVFANAGVARFEPVTEVTEANFDELMNTNVKGVFFTLQKSIPVLASGASIVVNASVAASKGSPTSIVYSATKAAVRSFTRTFAAALAEQKIRVNAVSPGPIETPIWSRNPISDKVKDTLAANNPMRRFGTPEEVAAAVAFLLSSESSYTTGAELFVDGGLTQL